MTDLMNTLYTYAQETLMMDYLAQDREYRQSTHYIEQHTETLRATLSPEQAALLDKLLGEQLVSQLSELQAIFMSGFSMALELSRS